jgi:pimeloyl-ACP methyl ester carboxylesterase
MLAVTALLPAPSIDRPSIILVHGAANSGTVWRFWQRHLVEHGWATYAIDLRGHGRSAAVDLSHTTMGDYAADVRVLARQFRRPPIVMGWSMGGLVAMLAAVDGGAAACVALAPSTPARQCDASVVLRTEEFGAEEYGITSDDPETQPTMPDLDRQERLIALASLSRESRLARDERQAGIVIEALPCPLLLVTGTADRAWPRERYADLWLKADDLSVAGASHWGLVLNRRALTMMVPAVVQWMAQHRAG